MPNPPSYWQNVELKVIVEDLTSVEDLVSVQPNVLLLVRSGPTTRGPKGGSLKGGGDELNKWFRHKRM